MKDKRPFPVGKGLHGLNEGMMLRDYFAAAALQAQISGMYAFDAGASILKAFDSTRRHPEEIIAIGAYKYADAMLKEREKK